MKLNITFTASSRKMRSRTVAMNKVQQRRKGHWEELTEGDTMEEMMEGGTRQEMVDGGDSWRPQTKSGRRPMKEKMVIGTRLSQMSDPGSRRVGDPDGSKETQKHHLSWGPRWSHKLSGPRWRGIHLPSQSQSITFRVHLRFYHFFKNNLYHYICTGVAPCGCLLKTKQNNISWEKLNWSVIVRVSLIFYVLHWLIFTATENYI